jgi:hypothetical protein
MIRKRERIDWWLQFFIFCLFVCLFVCLSYDIYDINRTVTESVKHNLQFSSLIGCLERFGLLKKENLFVEFGSGKGVFLISFFLFIYWHHFIIEEQFIYTYRIDWMCSFCLGTLSHYLQKILEKSKHILIDRANFRRKLDMYHKSEENQPNCLFKRIKADIKDLNFSLIPQVQNHCGT